MKTPPLFLLPLVVCLVLAESVAHGGCLTPYWEQAPLSARPAISIVATDLDSDGKPDIAAMTASTAFVLRNDGSGKFASPVDVYSGKLSGTMVAADFTGDGRTDLALSRDGALVVLPGNGDGTFREPIESAINIKPSGIAAARFDSDAALDLVAFDVDAAKLVVYRNGGTGTFAVAQSMTLQSGPAAFAAADIDADGKVDVIVAYGTRSTTDAFYGRGNGTLETPVTIVGVPTYGLAVADMDANGLPDISLADVFGRASVIRNLGGRSFGDPLAYAAFQSTLINSLAIGDITTDGNPDIVMTDTCGIRTLTGTGTGTLRTPWLADELSCVTAREVMSGALAMADFDGDGRQDVVATFPRTRQPAAIVEFHNQCGGASVTATVSSPLISPGQSVTVTVDVRPLSKQPLWIQSTGIVTIRDGEKVLTSEILKVNGPVALPPLDVGDHLLIADYGGDAQYEPTRSAPVAVRVTTDTTTTTLALDSQTPVFGDTLHVTTSVTSSTGDTPHGPLRFTVDGRLYNNVEYVAPHISIGVPSSLGTHTVLAEFAGDATHPFSRNTLTYVVGRRAPTIDVSNPFAVADQPSQVLITVNGPSGFDSPRGTVTLRVGDEVTATQTMDYGGTSFKLPALHAGRPVVRATYGGDTNYAPFETIIPFVVFPPSPPTTDARRRNSGVMVVWHGLSLVSISRKRAGGTWSAAVCCTNSPWIDTTTDAETVYLYRAESYDRTTVSEADVAMRFPFTNDPLLPEAPVSALHVAEVIRATNILRAAAGLGVVVLPPVTSAQGRHRIVGGGSGFPASQVTLLRSAINEARQALGAYKFVFNASVSDNATINAQQIQELREALQ